MIKRNRFFAAFKVISLFCVNAYGTQWAASPTKTWAIDNAERSGLRSLRKRGRLIVRDACGLKSLTNTGTIDNGAGNKIFLPCEIWFAIIRYRFMILIVIASRLT